MEVPPLPFHRPNPAPFNDAEGDPAATGSAADGTSTYAARRDHVHALSNHDHSGDAGDGGTIAYSALTGTPTIPTAANAAPQPVGTAAIGSATGEYALEDHVHGVTDQTITSRMVNLTWDSADVATNETTTSTTFADLSTSGPAVTLSPGVQQDHEITASAAMIPNADAAIASPAIAGAAAQDADGGFIDASVAMRVGSQRTTYAASVANGSTHTLKYRVGAGTGNFRLRRITAKAF